MAGVGRVHINNKPYNIAPAHEAYKVMEVPSHGDVDPKMERRVIYRDFSSGILKHREDRSMDATGSNMPSFSFIRQNRMSQGIYWGNGADTRSQDRIFAQRAKTVSPFSSTTEYPLNFGDASVYSYASAYRSVWALSTAPGTWTQSKTFAANVTDTVQFGGQLYTAIGSANGFWTWDQTTATTNWTQRTPTASYFTVIRNQLWRASNANIYSTVNTDPANQVWSGATVIGDPNTYITALDVYNDFILVFKQDGIYSADRSGNVYNVFPGFKNLGTNPRPLGQWRDKYYFASDVGMIWEWGVSGGVTRVGFDYAEPFPMNTANSSVSFSIPNAIGRGIAMTNYFIVPFEQYNPTATSGAYYLAWDGNGWHPFSYIPNASPKSIGMTGGNTNPVVPVLQFGYQDRASGNYKVSYMTNPLIDPFLAGSYDTAGQVVYMPVDNGALEDEYKVLEKLSIWVDNSTAGTLRIAYALDDDISSLTFTDLGAPTNDLAFGFQTFIPPIPFPTYHKIQLRITLTATASGSSPQLRYLIMHYKQRMPQRRVWTVSLLADQNLVGADGRIDARNTNQIVADLDKARQNRDEVVFVDPFGNSNRVYVEEVQSTIQILRGAQSPSSIVIVTLIQVQA